MSQSCGGEKEDPCLAIECLNGGVCEDGSCNCEAGYEGTLCTTLSRDKLLGTYDVEESCTDGSSDTATASISIDGTDDRKARINSTNLASIDITMTGINSFSVPEQEPCTGCELIEGGNGSLESEGVVEIELFYASGNICTLTLTPQ